MKIKYKINGIMSSNTPSRSSGRSRACGRWWLFTIGEQFWSPCLPPTVSYIKGQLEVGANTGYRHWQFVACFSSNVRPAAAKATFCGEAYAELTRSAFAEQYVCKEETRVPDTQFEFGVRPFRRDNRVDWERVWELAKSGNFECIPANIRVQNYSSLRRIRADFAAPAPIVRQCFVFFGPTGSGKSKRAWDEAGWSAYPKNPTTKFWDGYTHQQHVVIDEFRGEVGIGHLLRWLDRYPVLLEVKGSSVVSHFTTVWITSNLEPSRWYPDVDSATVDALMRRLQITEIK